MHGNVTATIINLPWDVALKKIMNANGYDVAIDADGIIVVDTFEAIAARQATIPLADAHGAPQLLARRAVAPMVAARLSAHVPARVAGGQRRTRPRRGQPPAARSMGHSEPRSARSAAR